MISTLKSEQSVEGDNNLQAGRDINQYGISYADAKEIAMDIYRNELPYLTKLASDKAWERVEPVLNEILAQIHQKKPEAINEFAEPEVQYMLGSAMKTASSTDDSVVHDTLVQLAVDHVFSKGRSYDRIIAEQPMEILQKMNRDILKSLQELAFWNVKCSFVADYNIINLLTKGIYSFDYGTYLESIGCAKLNSKNIVERKANLSSSDVKLRYLQVQSKQMYKIYGIYFHVDISKIEALSVELFRKKISKEDFSWIIKSIENQKISLQMFTSSMPYTWIAEVAYKLLCLEVIDEKELSNALDISIPKMFYSREDILALITKKQHQYAVNPYIFDYDLTPVGYKIQECLPPMIEMHGRTADEFNRLTLDGFIRQVQRQTRT